MVEPDARHDARGELRLHAALIADAVRATDTLAGARRRVWSLEASETVSLGSLFEARDLRRALPALERSERDAVAAVDAFERIENRWPEVTV